MSEDGGFRAESRGDDFSIIINHELNFVDLFSFWRFFVGVNYHRADFRAGVRANSRRVAECVMSPINRFCVFVLKLYKKYLSKGLNSGCIFTPTCSVYAMEAFEKFGFFKAFSLVLSRILRCNSLNPGGYDPPDDPEVKKWLY